MTSQRSGNPSKCARGDWATLHHGRHCACTEPGGPAQVGRSPTAESNLLPETRDVHTDAAGHRRCSFRLALGLIKLPLAMKGVREASDAPAPNTLRLTLRVPGPGRLASTWSARLMPHLFGADRRTHPARRRTGARGWPPGGAATAAAVRPRASRSAAARPWRRSR